MKSLILGAALATVAGIAVAQTVPPPPAPGVAGTKAERMLRRIDTNKDGVVSRDEALAQADRHFNRIDTNRDGKIDAAEHQAMRDKKKARREARGITPPAEGDAAARAPRKHHGGDANADGFVTREEFRARALKRFDRVDTNRDGRIDATERVAAPRHHRRGPPPAPAASPTDPAK